MWKAKKIAIQNEPKEAMVQVFHLLGVTKLPPMNGAFYMFCEDEYGWTSVQKIRLRKIKAPTALKILSEPEPINEPQPKPNQTPEHYRAHLMQPHDMLVKIYGAKAVALHLRMSAFEYRMRAGYKDDSASDLAKAMHCEAKAKELDGGEA